ncbi:MAG: siderophore-interacting protein [Actinomycetota bacterium]
MSEQSSFDPETAAQIEGLLDALNDSFADVFAFVARAVEADDSIEAAQVLTIDPRGLDVEVTAGGDDRGVRVDFEEPVSGIEGLEGALLGLLTNARAIRPTDPLTSFEERLQQSENQPTNHVRVQAVRHLSPRLRALTIGPMEGWEDLGGDQAVSLLIALPGRPIPETVRLSELRTMDDDVRPKIATYSVRRWDEAEATIEVWVVLHGNDPHTIGGWAGTAEVGTPVTVWGPRRAADALEGVSRFVGVCDEAGVAATLATAELLPDDIPVDLVVEIDDEAAEFALTDRPGVTVHWQHRGDTSAGTGTALLDATRRVVPAAEDGLFVFGAAESRIVGAIRRYVRRELEIPAGRVSMTGYWRHKSA